MGVSRSGKQLAVKLEAMADDFGDLPLAQVKEASLHIKNSILRLTPKSLSGVGKRGARIGVRYNVGQYDDGAKSLVFATGPFHLIERNTSAHRIPRVRKRGKPRPIAIPGVGVRMSAQHPGTKGKHPFERGVRAAMPEARRILSSTTGFVIHKHF